MRAALVGIALTLTAAVSAPALADDKLLQDAIAFNGQVLFLSMKVPGMVIGAVRSNGETAFAGFGKVADGSDAEPDRGTHLRIGSITKTFTGQVLADLVAEGTVQFTDPLEKRLGWSVPIPAKDGRIIRLIDLATHSSGLPREAEREPGPENDPFVTVTKDAYVKTLAGDPLLFPPGTGIIYSNVGFDLLAQALSSAAGMPYEDLLKTRVLEPAGMRDTGFALSAEAEKNFFQGHGFSGEPLPNVPTSPMIVGAGGLYSTPDDILRWLRWHLDRFAAEGAETRLLDQAAYVNRDGMRPVLGMDESGHMDAMGLGWVIMNPKGDRPLILQKAGGLQGTFSYVAFAPARGIGVFVAINEFNVSAALAMAAAVNDLLAELEPR